MNIPNLFVIGAPKCGTTALVETLRTVPEIYVPSEKEPRYFDAKVFYDYEEDYPVKTLGEYMRFYSNELAQNKKYRVDGSVFNMYSIDGIKSILEMSPDAKFILLVRDPVSASISMHAQRLKYSLPRMREISIDFIDCWNALQYRENDAMYPKSCRNKFLFRYDLLYSYQLYLPALMEYIEPENLFIERYEIYRQNPQDFYRLLEQFLGLKIDTLNKNKIINTSEIVSPSVFHKFVASMGAETHEIRNKLGLTGRKIQWLKRITAAKTTQPYKVSEDDMETVRKGFLDTYAYLETLSFYGDK